MLAILAYVVAFVLLLAAYIAFGFYRIGRLEALYKDRPRLMIAFGHAGGPRRRCDAEGLELAKQNAAFLDTNAQFDAAIKGAVSNNFSHPGAVYPNGEARAAAYDKLTTYALEEAERQRPILLSDMATFLCCMRVGPTTKLEKPVWEGRSALIVWTAAGCVGDSVKRLRAEGGMHSG